MSASPAGNQVPDVVGFDAVDADEIVRAAGLVPCGPDLEPAPDTGVIVAQEPQPAVHAEPASPVVLWTENPRAAGDRVSDPMGTVDAEPA